MGVRRQRLVKTLEREEIFSTREPLMDRPSSWAERKRWRRHVMLALWGIITPSLSEAGNRF